ncbi:MAG: NAD(P)H-hydrate dehydratase [Oscillospiraceae bacterium]|nr:NAD(P)H-hydrate dehydratase [Oscillospiraceae bacterium]
MMLLNSETMKALDAYAINELGIPSLTLMDNAAEHIVNAVVQHGGETVAVFAGSGNNGGDGICAAAKLTKLGYTVRTFMVGSFDKMTPDTKAMTEILMEAGGNLEEFSDSEDTAKFVRSCDVIIDAMLGIGLNAELRGKYIDAVSMINKAWGFVIAADIPTGVSADTGLVMGDAVKADLTVTFSCPKAGQFVEPGCVYCGKVQVCDIGIPEKAAENFDTETYLVTAEMAKLPKRRPDTHKGDYGRDFILAGSIGYTGAPLMASEAALRMGAGLVYLGVPDSIYSISAIRCTEAMPMPIPCDEDGIVSWNAREVVAEMMRKCDVCLAGPGMGKTYQTRYLLEMIVRSENCRVVLDADGINGIAENIDVLKEAAKPVILTPHPGEFARIGGKTENGRIQGARDFAKEYNCIVVLKGHRTVTALPDGRVYVNATGGPALAKGGSGDVLSGMVTALVGQGIPAEKAVVAAVYLHGLAGDICAEVLGEYSVIATDVIAAIPKAVKSVMR